MEHSIEIIANLINLLITAWLMGLCYVCHEAYMTTKQNNEETSRTVEFYLSKINQKQE